MDISIIKDDSVWNDFVGQANYNTFLHSQGWIEFNKFQNQKIWRLGMYKNQELISVCLIIKVAAKRATFLFCPHGPISKNSLQSQITDFDEYNLELKQWINYIKQLAKEENACFIRFQPIVLDTDLSRRAFEENGFKKAPIHMHTELSTVLNIKKTNEELLLGMRKTTRQMVKKGENLLADNTLKVEVFTEITDSVWQVYLETCKRGNFVGYSRAYLQKEYDSFKEKEKVHLYGIIHQEKLLSWGMVLGCGKRAFYHQGGNCLDKKFPTSYMCQWEGIRWAISQGFESYDFWGVAPENNLEHPWAKISLFKRGFGGIDVALLHAQDLILNWKYWPNWIVETIRAKKRGF